MSQQKFGLHALSCYDQQCFQHLLIYFTFYTSTALALQQYIEYFPISPTLLRVVRVFRVGRVLRLVKSAKGIRTLLFSLAVSMPALFNIGLLLFLVMFIYAIFGMNFFMHVKSVDNFGIDDLFNFQTFFRSMIILFQTCTSAGWDGVLAGLMVVPPECTPIVADSENRPNGDCGSPALAIVYLVSYLVISFLVVINMYIAVILENFSQATEDVQQGLTQDDFDMYYEAWEKFDEKATQYINLSQLSELVDSLEEPLRLPAPNIYKLVSLNITICEEDLVHCVDILDALTRNFLGTVGDAAGDLGDLKKGPERPNYHPMTTTLKRQREIFVARLIQRSWRNFVQNRRVDHERERLDSAADAAAAAVAAAADRDADSKAADDEDAAGRIAEAGEMGASCTGSSGSSERNELRVVADVERRPAARHATTLLDSQTIVNIEDDSPPAAGAAAAGAAADCADDDDDDDGDHDDFVT